MGLMSKMAQEYYYNPGLFDPYTLDPLLPAMTADNVVVPSGGRQYVNYAKYLPPNSNSTGNPTLDMLNTLRRPVPSEFLMDSFPSPPFKKEYWEPNHYAPIYRDIEKERVNKLNQIMDRAGIKERDAFMNPNVPFSPKNFRNFPAISQKVLDEVDRQTLRDYGKYGFQNIDDSGNPYIKDRTGNILYEPEFKSTKAAQQAAQKNNTPFLLRDSKSSSINNLMNSLNRNPSEMIKRNEESFSTGRVNKKSTGIPRDYFWRPYLNEQDYNKVNKVPLGLNIFGEKTLSFFGKPGSRDHGAIIPQGNLSKGQRRASFAGDIASMFATPLPIPGGGGLAGLAKGVTSPISRVGRAAGKTGEYAGIRGSSALTNMSQRAMNWSGAGQPGFFSNTFNRLMPQTSNRLQTFGTGIKQGVKQQTKNTIDKIKPYNFEIPSPFKSTAPKPPTPAAPNNLNLANTANKLTNNIKPIPKIK